MQKVISQHGVTFLVVQHLRLSWASGLATVYLSSPKPGGEVLGSVCAVLWVSDCAGHQGNHVRKSINTDLSFLKNYLEAGIFLESGSDADPQEKRQPESESSSLVRAKHLLPRVLDLLGTSLPGGHPIACLTQKSRGCMRTRHTCMPDRAGTHTASGHGHPEARLQV